MQNGAFCKTTIWNLKSGCAGGALPSLANGGLERAEKVQSFHLSEKKYLHNLWEIQKIIIIFARVMGRGSQLSQVEDLIDQPLKFNYKQVTQGPLPLVLETMF